MIRKLSSESSDPSSSMQSIEESREKENENEDSYIEKVDGIARWFGMNVVQAFFASLQHCSCVNLTTFDTEDDDEEEEAKDRPLMLTSFPSFNSTTSSSLSANYPVVTPKNPPRAVENLPV